MIVAKLLVFAVERRASDVHLSAGLAPMIRVEGDLRKLEQAVLSHDDIIKMMHELMTDKQWKDFEEQLETDFSFEISNLARFRVHMFMQTRGVNVVFRIISPNIPCLNELNLPAHITEIASYTHGLVLVTGPTGSGKSTTLAAIIDYINDNRQQHILTIEDPVEFVHSSKNCLITQREIYQHSPCFSKALRSALREDPDVILIGELRDKDTIRLAMTAAETGHLVLATLHTNSATKTIHRIIDVFSGEEKATIRSLLSESLQAVIAQRLVKKREGGRIPVCELMFCNPAIRNLIREDKIAQMYSVIQTGQAQGMQTFDQHLMQLLNKGWITAQVAYKMATNKVIFDLPDTR
ncbi:type IV pilus twitching motility protein PilT [Legionella fairfieldensis]|uniref:type IV pilus twitching motility protein PilT n=1 Tax=Legionella fairfieldensis TaxID=45064 RepID=UPI00048E750F|nr:type IV pilus twitching motility protein PilT [Legionella fairfieldensis]